MGEEPNAPGDFADDRGGPFPDDRGGSGYVTTSVAAEALGVNPRTIRTYIERGMLEAKAEGEGIQKTYLVSIDSVYSLRDRRGSPRKSRRETRERSAIAEGPGERSAEDLTSIIRDLTSELMHRS